MSQLLERSIQRMAEWGWPVSVLWGDTQRYGHFGYARAGLELRLELNRRTMRDVAPAPVEEVDLSDPEVAGRIEALYKQLPVRTDRPRFPYRLRRPNIRGFLGHDGYAIVRGVGGGNPQIIELASPTGREPGLVLGVMDVTFGSSATVTVEAEPSERLARLQRVAHMWSVEPQGMFRIIDWPKFMEAAAPLLEQRPGTSRRSSLPSAPGGRTSARPFRWPGTARSCTSHPDARWNRTWKSSCAG